MMQIYQNKGISSHGITQNIQEKRKDEYTMPYCNIKTNVKVEKKKELSKALTKTIELIPGKTENWIMTSIDDEAYMTFSGSDAPTAMITLKTFGQPEQKYYDMVTEGFCETVSKMLGIPQDRIYISHEPSDLWGWNGRNF